MLISFLVISLWTLGGAAATFPVFRERTLMWRLATGNVIGAAMAGTSLFVLTCFAGLSIGTAVASLVFAISPLLLLVRPAIRQEFQHTFAKARGQLQGGSKRFGGFAFYTFWLVVFCLFFAQAMYVTGQGIFTGGSNNLGDLPFHLGAILSFTEGGNFPPQNPSFAGARFSYPFIADLLTAMFMRLGADVKDAMFVQNVSWAMSLLILLEAFVARLAGSKLAGRLAPFLLFFSGGLGFVWFLKDYWQQGKGLLDLLWNLPHDYTISDDFRWGNSMVVLFITQRSLLLGMPLTIAVLGWIWKVFQSENGEKGKSTERKPFSHFPLAPFAVGLLAGTLPLIHLHSLLALFVVTGFCFVLRPEKWRLWVAFGVGVAVVAVPELLWSMSGSASKVSEFIGIKAGWDMSVDASTPSWQIPFLLIPFWLKNASLTIPMILFGGYVLFLTQRREAAKNAKENENHKPNTDGLRPTTLLNFYLPFLFLFLVSNTMKLAPWEWDNIKVLIYWFVGSLPLIAFGLVWLWERTTVLKVVAGCLFASLIAAGALDAFRTMSGQNKIKVFDADAMKIAEQIKAKTPPNALFLNAPTYNSAVVLSGRRSFMRYSGHLSSHGIDYMPREQDVKTIYQGGGVADLLLKNDAIEYVLISPIEVNDLNANEDYFRKFPLIAESGNYRVYQVK